jgi:hypothetical protein
VDAAAVSLGILLVAAGPAVSLYTIGHDLHRIRINEPIIGVADLVLAFTLSTIIERQG